eukprot:CAMPEP_0183331572 /NCGR_PEP_ID=MMETSP0164_2-20130417/884_1 /TAXON_ID=221442 /ORGANISM="Coccolithus pelagicus ssp braarudi, Strain PLY182g" /LENGTH=55 /DNA_ID=CAMNT_0025500081 /DNA_START=122 /DNA_END=289 /DNA_ORIENTATION=+
MNSASHSSAARLNSGAARGHRPQQDYRLRSQPSMKAIDFDDAGRADLSKGQLPRK